ncbi:hypothetical protein SS50377_27667 [Spironucleus salmonicida]|uniref:Transmembrane protein n=1 Tax=Spironucleus salmonicida TaxID=348837 RepID=V6LS86_9EUKA|nr:hypothetical protein SS50377_27667 [Spironucleus salmonicida]|eukprot:EST46556.1 Hypothetical protein SS50377_13360 [Spironucleus salmonicida]
MITLLAGVQLVNLTSCYNISSKIQHIAATSQIIVSLASTGNTACEILPDGLSVTYEDSANLSFTQDISNFIYVNTTSIILSIPAGKVFSSDIITARVIMTSYAEFTEIEIGAFEDLKLQLQNCFNILPVVTIFEQSFSAALVSTGFCADIIKDSQILKVRITFGGQEFTRLLKDFIGFDYATGQTNLLLSEMNIDQSVLIQPFLSGMIQFILKSGSSLIIDFQDIIVGPRNVEVFNYVRVLAVSGAVTFQNNMNQTYQRIYFEQMVQKKYNRVSYKITVKTSNNTVYQFSRDYGKYDLQPSQAIRISCKVTQTIGPEECIDLTVKMATTETLQYEGFIIFYQDFTILGMIKATNLKSSLACSSSGQLIVKSGQFCVRLPPSSNLDTCLFTTSYPVTYKVWVTNFGAAESYPGKFERNITYNVNTVPEVCMTCDDLIENVLGWTCQQYIDWSLDGHAVLVNITTRGASPAGTKSYSTVFLDQIVNSNYLIVLIIVFVIGGIYLVFVIVYSIGGMVVFQIQLKKRLKKRK